MELVLFRMFSGYTGMSAKQKLKLDSQGEARLCA